MQDIIHIIVGLWLVLLTVAWYKHFCRDDRRWKRIMVLIDRMDASLKEMESKIG